MNSQVHPALSSALKMFTLDRNSAGTEKDMNNLLQEPLSKKLDYCFGFGNERSRLDFCEDVLNSICGDYDNDPQNNQAIQILERKLDERIINHFSEEI